MTADALPRHLSASDSVAWRIERNPQLRSTITLVITLDRAPTPRALRAGLEAASVAFPRLRQRVVEVPLHASTPVWSNDPDFDLDFHVRSIRAAGERSLRGVLDLAASIGMQSFDRTRPLWEWTTVEDLEDGGAAAILKLHHSVTDGVGGMRLMALLFDRERHDAAVRRVDPAAVPEGEHPDAAQLRFHRELEYIANVDQYVAKLVARCTGDRTVGELVDELAAQTGMPADGLRPACLQLLRGLVERGFLLPVQRAIA